MIVGSARVFVPGNPMGPSSAFCRETRPSGLGQGPGLSEPLGLPEASHQGSALHQGQCYRPGAWRQKEGYFLGQPGAARGAEGTHNVGACGAEGLRARR